MNKKIVLEKLLVANKLLEIVEKELLDVILYVDKKYRQFQNRKENPYSEEYDLMGMSFEEFTKVKRMIEIYREKNECKNNIISGLRE